MSILGTASVTGGVHLLGSPNIGINSSNNTVKIEPKTTGATFGVVFTNKSGTPLGQSGSEVVGLPVFGISGATAINVTIVGGLSGMTITGLAFPTSFGVSGGTLAVSGGTLDYIERIGSISGGTLNIGNTVSVTGSISVSNLPSTQNVSVVNTAAIKVGLDTFSNTSSVSLKTHLEGLTVSLLGGGAGGGGLGDVTSISGASMGFAVGSGMTGITGIGVTFAPITIASMPQVVISNTQAVNVQGGALSLTTNPVGITLPGNLVGLRGFGVSGEYLGVTLVGVGMSGNALNVSIVGGLSGITITGFAFPTSFGVSGGTLAVSGGTLDYIGRIGSINGGTLNIGNTVGITGSVRISEVSQGITFKTVLVDQNGNILTNEKGIPVFGVSGATAVGITWSGTPTFGISGPVSVQQVTGSTFGVVFTNNFGAPLGMSGSTVVGMPVFGISGATVIGVTFAGISIVGTVATTASLSFPASGVTMIFENTGTSGIPVFGVSGATAIGVVFTNNFGVPLGMSGATVVGMPVFGVSGATALRVTFTNNFGVPLGLSGATVVGMPVFGVSGATALRVTFTNNFGVPLGLSGATVVGMPVFGVSGATALGVVFTNNFGAPLGLSGATVVGMPVFGVSGATAIGVTGSVYLIGASYNTDNKLTIGIWHGVTVTGTSSTQIGVTFGSVTIDTVAELEVKTKSGTTLAVGGLIGIEPKTTGTTFGVVFTNNFGAPLGMSGATVVGMPVFGVSGATAIGVTGSVYLIGASYNTDNKLTIGIWHGVTVTGTSSTQIGVTFGSVTIDTVAELEVKTKSGTTLAVGGLIGIEPKTTGTTFGVVFTNNFGAPLGISGSTVVGMPVFGVSGATAIGITFGAITFGAGGMGVTFGGITFNTTRTIITGASFGAGLGVPVYGIVGTTAVQVTIIGGTVSGIFTTEAQGITITGVTTGIPVFGVAGGTAIGVTFSGGSIGVTIAGGITGGVYLLGSPAVTGSVHLLGTPSVVISSGTITSITNDVNVAPASAYRNEGASNTVLAGRTAAGFVTTQKAGSNFARGLTLDATFIGQDFVSDSLVFGAGSTIYYLKSDPVCVTKNYTGPGRIVGASVEGNQSVPLKVGLYIQLTKWDLISHVLVGYTAGTTQEFARNAQTLTREYQVAPIWGNAMEQFRKYAGASGNSSTFEAEIRDGGLGAPNTIDVVQKQFVGVIEKPTRLFIPCKDAGEVYVQVVGDYTNHAIGSGFWSHEGGSAQWSAHTLYERGYYASDFSGMAGNADGYTDLDINGNPAGNFGPFPFTSNPEIAIQKIIDSYANNPFIRIWGH